MRSKTKAIQEDFTYFGMFRHIQTCSGIIQAYSEHCITQAYSEPWYIQNQKLRHVQNPVENLQWSRLQKLLTGVVVFANYFCNSFSHSLLILIKIYILPQKYLLHIKKYSGPGGWGEFWYTYAVVIFFL